MHSCIYVGQVRHRRFTPTHHAFNYKMFQMYLDLDELPSLFTNHLFWSVRNFNLARFCREDHWGDSDTNLADCVRQLVKDKTGKTMTGPVRLLTHLRYFGFGFNPVSFYYCFDEQGDYVRAVVAEVSNTPWNQQHVYVLDVVDPENNAGALLFLQEKQFHVSPFMPMDMQYRWRLTVPGESLNVHLENHKDGSKVFDATLQLNRKPIDSWSLAKVLVSFPLMTFKVVAAIYFEAVRLWLKKTPVYDIPKNPEAPQSAKKL